MEMFEIDDDDNDNMVDNCMEHHPFSNGMPDIKSFHEVEDFDAISVRTHCEGTWVEN